MTHLTLDIRTAPVVPPPAPAFRLKRWDEIDIKWGYSTSVRLVNGQRVGQFSLIQPLIEDTANNTFGIGSANDNSCPIDLGKIEALQVADDFTVRQKMGWLTAPAVDNGWGSPINTVKVPPRMIGAVWAGQPITILEKRVLPYKLHGISMRASCSRIAMGWNVLQKVTAVDKNDVYTDRPKGVIWLPIVSRANWRFWVPDEWITTE